MKTETVPKGYKRTEVGVIPEEWEVTPLKKLISSAEYGSSAKSMPSGRVPVLRMGNLQSGKIDWRDLVFTSDENEISKYLLNPGDVLFNRTNTVDLVGKVSLYDGSQPAIFAGYLIRINTLKGMLDNRFLNYVLNAEFSKQYSRQVLSVAVSQANINGQKLKTYPIPLPPTFAEQQAIAAALADADALIESLEQLLAKKHQIKQGAMQELLTGKRRLPGFGGKWEKKRLAELGVFLKGSGVRKDEAQSGDLPCVRYGELYTHHSDVVRKFNSWISEDVAATALRVRKGDILFAGSGETKAEIGRCASVLDDGDVYVGGDIIVLRPSVLLDPVFCGYFLNTPKISRQKASFGQGDAVVHIGATALGQIEGQFPSFPEQTAIAMVLSDMDSKLEVLEVKLAKARQIKQAMMQQLLTGKARLASLEAKAAEASAAEVPTTTLATGGHNWAFNEAVLISVLAGRYGTSKFPLSRFRYTKFLYLFHRHVEHVAQGFRKKAAGPYNPDNRYKGPESIAQKSQYVVRSGSGFVAGPKHADALRYFETWYPLDHLQWLDRFRYESNDALEVLTTVDMACEDLRKQVQAITVQAVKDLIQSEPEWLPKLKRDIFSDMGIAAAIRRSRELLEGAST